MSSCSDDTEAEEAREQQRLQAAMFQQRRQHRREDQQAIKHHMSLQVHLNDIFKGLQDDTLNKEQLKAATTLAIESEKGIGSYLSGRCHAMLYNEIREDDSTAASRVFAISELAEAILLHTDFDDLLNAYEISSGLKSIVEGSHKLQMRLFLAPDEAATEIRKLSDHIGHHWEFERCGFAPDTGEPNIKLKIVLLTRQDTPYPGYPSFGSRTARMLICQPPIKHLIFQYPCLSDNSHWTRAVQELHSATGITIGELYDSVRDLLRDKRCEPCVKEKDDSRTAAQRFEQKRFMLIYASSPRCFKQGADGLEYRLYDSMQMERELFQ